MQTSLAELQFPSSCTLSFPSLSLSILLCFSLGSYIYSCVYMSSWVWVCACEWVSAHSFAHALIHFHHLYVVKSAEFNVLRLSDLHLLMLPLLSLLFISTFPTPSLSFFILFFRYLPNWVVISCTLSPCASALCGFQWISFWFVMPKKEATPPAPHFHGIYFGILKKLSSNFRIWVS